MLLLFTLLSISLVASTKESIEKIVSSLNKIEEKSIEKIVKNPFAVEKKELIDVKPIVVEEVQEKKVVKKVNLQWTNNKKALIDNVWYKEGEKVHGKEIVYIGNKGIILSVGETKREIIRLKSEEKFDGFEIGKVK